MIVIDIDDTIANNDHRTHLVVDKGKYLGGFFDRHNLLKDKPRMDALQYFWAGQFLYGDHMFLTARPHYTYDTTFEWLVSHGFARPTTPLICRPVGEEDVAGWKHAIFKDFKGKLLLDDDPETLSLFAFTRTPCMEAPQCWQDGSLLPTISSL